MIHQLQSHSNVNKLRKTKKKLRKTQHSAPATAAGNTFGRTYEVPVCATARTVGFVKVWCCPHVNLAQLDPPPCKSSVADHRAVDSKGMSGLVAYEKYRKISRLFLESKLCRCKSCFTPFRRLSRIRVVKIALPSSNLNMRLMTTRKQATQPPRWLRLLWWDDMRAQGSICMTSRFH